MKVRKKIPNQGEDRALVVGRWYRIRHRSESQRHDRMSVMRYVGVADGPGRVGHRFSTWPAARTTKTMPHSWIISVEEVPATTTPIIGARWETTPAHKPVRRAGRRA